MAFIQIVVPQQSFHDDELMYLKSYFAAAGAMVLVASSEMAPMRGMLNRMVTPDNTIASISVTSIDALLILGGNGSPRYLWADEVLQRKIQQALVKGKVIGATGLSGVVLAHAGVLQGKKAAGVSQVAVVNEYKRCGVPYVSDPLVVSDTIVTTSGPEQTKVFASTIMGMIVALARQRKKAHYAHRHE